MEQLELLAKLINSCHFEKGKQICSLLPILWRGLREWLPAKASKPDPTHQLGLTQVGQRLSDGIYPLWPANWAFLGILGVSEPKGPGPLPSY